MDLGRNIFPTLLSTTLLSDDGPTESEIGLQPVHARALDE
jgi:hypothetical protein